MGGESGALGSRAFVCDGQKENTTTDSCIASSGENCSEEELGDRLDPERSEHCGRLRRFRGCASS